MRKPASLRGIEIKSYLDILLDDVLRQTSGLIIDINTANKKCHCIARLNRSR
jgi:hypothetical protein